jgi:hypothetical protein
MQHRVFPPNRLRPYESAAGHETITLRPERDGIQDVRWCEVLTELGAADKRSAWGKIPTLVMTRPGNPNLRQPFGSCRMRSPIMFFCTGEVPPAIVMLSL